MSKYRFARVRISILSSKIYIKAYLNVTSLFVAGTWLASRISLRRPPGARYYFDVRIEIQTLTNLYLDIHEGIPKYDLPLCTWPTSTASSGIQVPDIIFDLWILILTITYLYLVMQEGTPKYDLPICIQDQPPADSRCQTSFIKIEILTLTN